MFLCGLLMSETPPDPQKLYHALFTIDRLIEGAGGATDDNLLLQQVYSQCFDQ